MTAQTVLQTPTLLIDRAKEAMQKAYAPYSHHYVGAALLSEDGRIWTGCNIENAAYSPSICAERTAIAKAVSEGARNFAAIAIVGGREGHITGSFPPCGVCRQVMAEFCCPDTFLVFLGTPTGFETHSLRELLPSGFFPSALQGD